MAFDVYYLCSPRNLLFCAMLGMHKDVVPLQSVHEQQVVL